MSETIIETDAASSVSGKPAGDALLVGGSETDPETGGVKTGRSIIARLGPAGVLGAVWVTAPALLGFLILRYAKTCTEWLLSFGSAGAWVFIAIFMVSAGTGLLPTYAQALMSGFAFGLAVGIPAALAGFTGAALIGYEIARGASGERVMKLLDERPKYATARDALVGGGFWKTLGIVTLMRVPFSSPFALTNLVLASVKVKRVPYLLGTVIGMAPRTVLFVWIGHGFQELTKESFDKPWWLLAAGGAMMLVMILILSHIASKAMEKVTGAGGK